MAVAPNVHQGARAHVSMSAAVHVAAAQSSENMSKKLFVGGLDWNTALVGYFTPAFLGNTVVVVILLPVLMIAFAAVASRRGR